MIDLKEKHYQNTFEAVIAQLTMRRRLDNDFDLDECKKLLHTEYINDGNDFIGRGSLGDIVQDATIAAYEAFIVEWESEINQSE
jgi:hypothetical protein